MTRRVLTTIGSAAAVATAVGTCLLLAPTPQAQADICSGHQLRDLRPHRHHRQEWYWHQRQIGKRDLAP
jgi:hypothetical protein